MDVNVRRAGQAIGAAMLLLGAPGLAGAQEASAAVTAEIQAVENTWSVAMRTKDVRALDAIIAPEYYLFESGENKTLSKNELIEAIRTDKLNYMSVTNAIRRVTLYGNVAVALGASTEISTKNGKSFIDHDSWQTVFAKRNGKRVAVASHEAEVNDVAPPPTGPAELLVVAREREGWDAIARKDFDAYGRILAPGYHEIGPDGYHDRALALKSIRDMVLTRYTMTDINVVRVSPDIAILNYRGTLFGTFLGKPMQTAPFAYHNSYVRINGAWLATFGEETVP